MGVANRMHAPLRGFALPKAEVHGNPLARFHRQLCGGYAFAHLDSAASDHPSSIYILDVLFWHYFFLSSTVSYSQCGEMFAEKAIMGCVV